MADSIKNDIKNEIEKTMRIQAAHLEAYAAAFVAQVGSEEASKYTLVQRIEGNKISWTFEKIP